MNGEKKSVMNPGFYRAGWANLLFGWPLLQDMKYLQ